jgi:hypothetical protein
MVEDLGALFNILRVNEGKLPHRVNFNCEVGEYQKYVLGTEKQEELKKEKRGWKPKVSADEEVEKLPSRIDETQLKHFLNEILHSTNEMDTLSNEEVKEVLEEICVDQNDGISFAEFVNMFRI